MKIRCFGEVSVENFLFLSVSMPLPVPPKLFSFFPFLKPQKPRVCFISENHLVSFCLYLHICKLWFPLLVFWHETHTAGWGQTFPSAHVDINVFYFEAIIGRISPWCVRRAWDWSSGLCGRWGASTSTVSNTEVFIICHKYTAALSRNIAFPHRFLPLCPVLQSFQWSRDTVLFFCPPSLWR